MNSNRAPTPAELRIGEVNIFGQYWDAVCWDIPSQNERISQFEFSAAAIGSDEWTPFYYLFSDYSESPIVHIAAYLDEGEYRLRITALPRLDYEPSEPAYFDNWTLTVKSGGNANTYSVSVSDSEYGERVYIHGIDDDCTAFYMAIHGRGQGGKFVVGHYNYDDELSSTEPLWFSKEFSNMQSGDVITIRELISIENNGTNHTVTFKEATGPIQWP